jgi:tRNA uridine 5-carbamoylmethylation protein Kti12
MKLIFLYGPPGVGKLTVSKELEKRIGFTIFHNHLVNDVIASVISHENPDFNKQKERLYLEMISLGAKHGKKGLIFTFCYSHPHDLQFINKISRCIEKAKGEVCFVQLICSKDALIHRVQEESRKQYRKVKDPQVLKNILQKHDLFTEIPQSKSLCIDNTHLSPEKTGEMIINHYHLGKI